MLLRVIFTGILVFAAWPLHAQSPVTFNNQVVRIFQQHCQNCHRPDNIAPFSLLSYGDARLRASLIKQAVQSGEMPPWKPVNAHGVFEGERTLTDREVQTIVNWVDQGAEEGNAADLPAPATFPSEWSVGTPDIVLQPTAGYTLDPASDDVYRCFSIPIEGREATNVRGLEVLPGNPEIVHHVLLFVDANGQSIALDNADPNPGYECFGGPGFIPSGGLGAWAPGASPVIFPVGVGVHVPAGGRVVMQVHYSSHSIHAHHAVPVPHSDLTKVGLLTSAAPLQSISFLPVVNPFFRIPAGAANHEVTAILPIFVASELISIAPHMHLLGRKATVDARFPNGTTRRLIQIDDWDFSWQNNYTFKEPILLPAGTIVTMRATYDNSTNNPNNPSTPPISVGWGERTVDEMALTFLGVKTPGAPQLSLTSYSVADRGGLSMATQSQSNDLRVGYGRITAPAGTSTPSGIAIFGYRQNNVLITEAAVAASPAITRGRIYAEVSGTVNSGIAIANPNAERVDISFFFTGPDGTNVHAGTTTLDANAQTAKFLNDTPFNLPAPFSGSFTLTASKPVSVVALRGVTNERSEFLITALPVVNLDEPGGTELVFPHFAIGDGWASEILLVNPGDTAISGTIRFSNPAGETIETLPYEIAARASQSFSWAFARRGPTATGTVTVVPASGTALPAGSLVFSFFNAGIRVTEAGIAGMASGGAFRLYTETSGNFDQAQTGSIQSGFAVANTGSTTATVNLELTNLDGTLAGRASLTIPPGGQMARFLNQIDGFDAARLPNRGLLRVSSTSAILVAGLRMRYNERGEGLIATTPPAIERSTSSNATLFFPHFADSGGYATQFILFNASPGRPLTGTLQFISQQGQPLELGIR